MDGQCLRGCSSSGTKTSTMDPSGVIDSKGPDSAVFSDHCDEEKLFGQEERKRKSLEYHEEDGLE